MNSFRAALGFLTIVPAGRIQWTERTMARAVAWYPAVGILLGLLLCAVTRGADALWPAPISAAVVLAVWVAATGALHLDGVADVADAAFAPVTPNRRREILRDVHHGTFGIVAVALVLLLKFSVVASFAGRAGSALVLAAPVAGRAGVLPAMHWFPTVSEKGFGTAARSGATLGVVGLGGVLAFAIAIAALGWVGAISAAVAAMCGVGGAAAMSRRLGGLNGDCYGTVIEIVEVTWLVAAAAFVAGGHAEIFPLWNGW